MLVVGLERRVCISLGWKLRLPTLPDLIFLLLEAAKTQGGEIVIKYPGRLLRACNRVLWSQGIWGDDLFNIATGALLGYLIVQHLEENKLLPDSTRIALRTKNLNLLRLPFEGLIEPNCGRNEDVESAMKSYQTQIKQMLEQETSPLLLSENFIWQQQKWAYNFIPILLTEDKLLTDAENILQVEYPSSQLEAKRWVSF